MGAGAVEAKGPAREGTRSPGVPVLVLGARSMMRDGPMVARAAAVTRDARGRLAKLDDPGEIINMRS